MNKQFIISVIVVFVGTMLTGFVVHGLLLSSTYAALPNLFRPEQEAQDYFQYMILAHVLMATGLTWIYRMGRDDTPWLGQGLRFGLAIIVLMTLPIYLIYYAVQPMPADLTHKQMIFDSIGMLVMGPLVALMNRK
jgi:hypothetical protein